YHADPRTFGCVSGLDGLNKGPYDAVLVCTKSYDSLSAAKDIAQHPSILDKNSKIILFQNGWGNAEIFAEQLPDEDIYNARVITGFSRPQQNQVDITVHVEAIHVGSLFGAGLAEIEHICQGISQGGISCEITPDIERDLWAKLLFNCALNPLGAIFNVPYGTLAEQEYTKGIMNGVITEIFKVMEAAGYKTHWQDTDEYLEIFYSRIVPLAAKHKSSTLQDIHAGKTTEIDALNGAIMHLGEDYGIAVPFNYMLWNMIKFMEEQKIMAH
ncbi:MAG: 2-dehydropantoate 2-reductase, partial [Candidatus Electrothrix sp. AR3]|nr:2-dehydropantoate 2-reductase [Candidatus Electrothrix sp. AR3]